MSDTTINNPSRSGGVEAGGLGRIAVVAGTRPEIIKLAPVIDTLELRLGPGAAYVIDTGQHYDDSMSGRFWHELGLRPPDVRLHGGGLSRSGCIGYLTAALGDLFATEPPGAVVVQGDTNSTAAGALAANATGAPLVHVEAGLRSGDRSMPEEHNRIVADHLADVCCAATEANAANLVAEGIAPRRVAVTGNTVVDAVARQFPDARQRAAVLAARDLIADRYALATVHRPENTDDPATLHGVFAALGRLADRLPVVVALHPRTRAALVRQGWADMLSPMVVTPPLGSRDFLALAAHAAVVVSDSGGVAEEVTVLKRPLLVVRRSTERLESIVAGFARLVRPDEIAEVAGRILDAHSTLLARLGRTPCPYGDGHSAARIVALVEQLLVGESVHV